MKINMGCGCRNFGPEWIHIDGGDYNHIDSNDIFLKKYEKNSVELIYAAHFIEYFDQEKVFPLMIRWKEVLKPNGVLRLAVPDFEVCNRLYLEKKYPIDSFIGPLYGKMKMRDQMIYHKIVYDFSSLKKMLNKVGMRKIKKYNWKNTEHASYDDHSQAYLPHMDKENGILISLNVECIK